MFEFFMGTMFPAKLKTQKITSYQEDGRFTGSPEDSPYLLKINQEQCQIKSTNFKHRKVVSIPLFLVIFVTSIFMLNYFLDGHISRYRNFIFLTNVYKEKHEHSINITKGIEKYRPFFDKEPNLYDYLVSYYSGGFYAGTKYSIYLTILLVFGIGYCLYITGKSALFGPYPILVLDRKRQILYTWENNKVYMARYKDSGYATPNNNLFIKLFSFNTEKNRLDTILFQPNASDHSSLFLSEKYENNAFISFINTYMQKGRDAITDHDFECEPLTLYFGSYSPPADADSQIANTVGMLDKETGSDA
ncbi:hypothetical protein [Morganella sp. GD04133]|uniref:hypothetical protein n=1 Tax=Morganella sp. GD04133 TaxID=2975435 RepID=UPI00244976B0|nr:hypothetical protein [Morganella sp. GD04133]MDH0356055.1 hypothetical protein [Morganella sp. GD04133]